MHVFWVIVWYSLTLLLLWVRRARNITAPVSKTWSTISRSLRDFSLDFMYRLELSSSQVVLIDRQLARIGRFNQRTVLPTVRLSGIIDYDRFIAPIWQNTYSTLWAARRGRKWHFMSWTNRHRFRHILSRLCRGICHTWMILYAHSGEQVKNIVMSMFANLANVLCGAGLVPHALQVLLVIIDLFPWRWFMCSL